MSYTDQDVREGRQLMDDGRQNRLVIGDKLLSVSALGQDGDFERYCEEISLSPRTARQYRHTARMCTPPVRQLVAGSGVHVSYSVLREGARLAPSGKPYDEGYSTLRSLLNQARESEAGRVSVAQYQRALGTGPSVHDLLGPSGGTSLAEFLGCLDPAERDKVLRELLEENDAIYNSAKRVMDDKRRRDREGRTECPGGEKPDKAHALAHALARDLVRLRDQVTALMNRYPPSATMDFSDEQRAACKEALGTLEVLAMWIKVRVGGQPAAASRDRVQARDLVTV
ncbi:MAG: hypothetical protein JO362_02570 [Streptomycetaceae bacterium]|nr:hypothetical protein [Streptomycetaceae bacterium]